MEVDHWLRPAREAFLRLPAPGLKVRLLHQKPAWPFNSQAMASQPKANKRCKALVMRLTQGKNIEDVPGWKPSIDCHVRRFTKKEEDTRGHGPATSQQDGQQTGEFGWPARQEPPVNEQRGQGVGKRIGRRDDEPSQIMTGRANANREPKQNPLGNEPGDDQQTRHPEQPAGRAVKKQKSRQPLEPGAGDGPLNTQAERVGIADADQ